MDSQALVDKFNLFFEFRRASTRSHYSFYILSKTVASYQLIQIRVRLNFSHFSIRFDVHPEMRCMWHPGIVCEDVTQLQSAIFI